MLLPVAPLAGLAAVVSDLALRALAKRGTPTLLLAEEAAEQIDPQDSAMFRARLLALAGLRCAGILVSSQRRLPLCSLWTQFEFFCLGVEFKSLLGLS